MSDADDEAVNRREVAYRLFAAEFEDSDLSYSESDDDRSPNYVVTPTGARVNRLFAVGVLTEVEQVSDNVLRGRIVDPTGAFVAYAGQYQPDEQAFLERVDAPTFVAMTGKARTFQPDDSDQIFTSVRPESINEVSAETRDRWTVQTAEQTLDRIGEAARALRRDQSGDALQEALLDEDVDEALAVGIPLAFDHYGTTPTYLDALRDLALDAARVVVGERDQAGDLTADPDQSGPVTAHDIPAADVDSSPPRDDHETSDVTATDATTDVGSDTGTTTTDDAEGSVSATDTPETSADATTETTASTSTASGAKAETASSDEVATEPERDDTGTTESLEDPPTDSGDDLGDFDSEEFELEEETREQVKEEHGIEFQTGTEVEEPDDETPEVADTTATEPPGETEPAGESTTSVSDDSGADTVTDHSAADGTAGDASAHDELETDAGAGPGDSEPSEGDASADEAGEDDAPDDLQAAVVELMGEVDDGDGAPRDDLLAEMKRRYGVGEDDTGDAIQDALMDGECYEPGDGRYKPI